MRFAAILTVISAAVAVVPIPAPGQRPPIVRQVRAAVNAGEFTAADSLLADYSLRRGEDPAWIEAFSWVGRGQLDRKRYAEAAKNASKTREKALETLKKRSLKEDFSLEIALGNAIEVYAQVLDARSQKSEAVAYLQAEVTRWRGSPLETRVRKNLNLVSLKGKPAPPVSMSEWLGARPPAVHSLKGKTVVLFFWAHWCGDCKRQAPVLARLKRELGEKLVIIGPTQPYGYVAGGQEAPRAAELRYIDEIRGKFFSDIPGMTVPVSEDNFRNWGASTTPTLVVLDPAGVVKLYHPGDLSYEELLPHVRG